LSDQITSYGRIHPTHGSSTGLGREREIEAFLAAGYPAAVLEVILGITVMHNYTNHIAKNATIQTVSTMYLVKICSL